MIKLFVANAHMLTSLSACRIILRLENADLVTPDGMHIGLDDELMGACSKPGCRMDILLSLCQQLNTKH